MRTVHHLNNPRRVQPVTQAGFTVPELLVAIVVILGLVIASVLILRPDTYEYQNSQAERRTAVARLSQLITKYHAETGAWPAGITTSAKTVGTDKGYVDFCKDIVPAYADDLPLDPIAGVKLTTDMSEFTKEPCTAGIEYDSGFKVQLSQDSQRVTVIAPRVLEYPEIRVTR